MRFRFSLAFWLYETLTSMSVFQSFWVFFTTCYIYEPLRKKSDTLQIKTDLRILAHVWEKSTDIMQMQLEQNQT